MKAKGQEYYQKLVIGGQWKKVYKVLEGDDEQAKDWIIDTMGRAAVRNDECYNQLVDGFQKVTDKHAKLKIIEALGNTERSPAISQVEYMALHTEDPELQEALTKARHNLKATVK